MLFEQKVAEIVESQIRPQLRSHGGDISIKKVEDGNVWILYHGACKGCPSAKFTTEEVVDKILRDALGSELKEVYLVTETSEELLNFAKTILNKEK